jgi:uncharacterized membrane protein
MSAPGPTSPSAPAAFAADSELRLVLPGRTRPAGDGVKWVGDGWPLFTKSPLMWILALIILVVIVVIVGLVPFIGSFALVIVKPVFYGGLFVACRAIERGGEFELEHLFAGFRTQLASLCLIGLLLLVGMVLILLVFVFFVGFGILSTVIASGNTENLMAVVAGSAMAILLGSLVTLALLVPLLAAYWFAPALVIMHGVPPLDAMKASFGACLRNFMPFLLYSIVMLVLCIVAMIPFGMGLLVWIPLSMTSTYAAYRAIFTEDSRPAATVTV